jgi:hypothetical protein
MSDFTPFAIEIPHILQPDDQLYFLHCPKTAGQSFSLLLESFYSPNEVLLVHRDIIGDISQEQLLRYHLFTGHHGYQFLDRFADKKPLWLTMLRNPVDRLISQYYYLKEKVQEDDAIKQFNPLFAESKNLLDYIAHPTSQNIHNVQTKQLYSFEQLLLPSNVLDIVKDRLINECAFIGITELYDNSVALLYYTFAWRPHLMKREKRVNVTKDRPKINEVDSKIIDLIIEQNQLDIELYHFATELFSKRYDAMMQQTLQKNYEKLFSKHRQPQSTISLRHDDPLFDNKAYAQGWHNNDGEMRWTGPENTSLIDFCLEPSHSYFINIELKRGITKEILDSFQLFVNQNLIPLSQQILDESIKFYGVVPNHILDKQTKHTEVTFHVDHTARPLNNPKDTRLLGIALKQFDIVLQSG